MNEPLVVNDDITIPAADMQIELSRSGGPGGQHVNTTETRVRLRFALRWTEALPMDVKLRIRDARPGDVTDEGYLLLVSDRHRSRQMNLDDVRARLVEIIRQHLVPPRPRRATRPSRASKEARVVAKTRRGAVKSTRRKVSHDD